MREEKKTETKRTSERASERTKYSGKTVYRASLAPPLASTTLGERELRTLNKSFQTGRNINRGENDGAPANLYPYPRDVREREECELSRKALSS